MHICRLSQKGIVAEPVRDSEGVKRDERLRGALRELGEAQRRILELQDDRSRLDREVGQLSVEITPLRMMKGVWDASMERMSELEDALREASAAVRDLSSVTRRDADRISDLEQEKKRLEAALSDMEERAAADLRALTALRSQADAMRSSTAAEGQTVEKLAEDVGRLQREVEERSREASVAKIDMKRMEAEKEGAEDEVRRGHKVIERMEKELASLQSLYEAQKVACSALVKDKEKLSSIMLVQQVNLREAAKVEEELRSQMEKQAKVADKERREMQAGHVSANERAEAEKDELRKRIDGLESRIAEEVRGREKSEARCNDLQEELVTISTSSDVGLSRMEGLVAKEAQLIKRVGAQEEALRAVGQAAGLSYVDAGDTRLVRDAAEKLALGAVETKDELAKVKEERDEAVKRAKRELEAAKAAVESLKGAKSELEAAEEAHSQALQEAEERCEQLRSQISSLEATVAGLESGLAAACKEGEGLREELAARDGERERAQAADIAKGAQNLREQLEGEIAARERAEEEVARLQSSLREVEQRLEGSRRAAASEPALMPPYKVAVKVIGARDLPKMDLMGKCDAYCVLEAGEGQTGTTKRVDKNYDPDFDEEFSFDVLDTNAALTLQVRQNISLSLPTLAPILLLPPSNLPPSLPPSLHPSLVLC